MVKFIPRPTLAKLATAKEVEIKGYLQHKKLEFMIVNSVVAKVKSKVRVNFPRWYFAKRPMESSKSLKYQNQVEGLLTIKDWLNLEDSLVKTVVVALCVMNVNSYIN